MTDMILDQLRHLAGTLTVLRSRVREAVAGEVGKAVADAVAEVLTAALGGRLVHFSRYAGTRSTSYGRSDWDEPDRHAWDEPQVSSRFDHDEPGDEPARAGLRSPEAALALAWTAGRWWLARRGSPLGAAGVGLAAGAALMAGGPLAQTSLAVLWAVHRLLAATDAIGDGAKALDRI